MPAWRRLLKRAGLSGLRIHDLRSTAGSYMAITGTALQIIGKALGHTQQQTTAIYSRLTNEAVRPQWSAEPTRSSRPAAKPSC